MKHHDLLPLLLALASAATAQEPTLSPLPSPTAPAVGIDRPGEAAVFWARGETWKARVDARGVTFYPRFPGAGEHTPIALRLRAGTTVDPEHEGDGFTFRRSPTLVERWQPRAQGIEQSFVLSAPPATSDLELFVDVETALRYAGHDDGLVFVADGLGQVTYAEGIVFDSAGKRAPIVPAFEGGAIVLRVSAEFLAGARYPVTIDPLLGNFVVASLNRNQTVPDVARALTEGEDFYVIFEDEFTTADHDIRAVRYRTDGTAVETINFDITTEDCVTPQICPLGGNSVLAVWDNDNGSSTKGIQARTFHAINRLGNVAQVTSDGLGEESHDPDVGGGTLLPSNNQGQMCVWVRHVLGNHSLRGVALQSNGVPTGGDFVIDNSPGCDPRPRIAPTGGVPLHWGVVWQSHVRICGDPGIWWAAVNPGGVILPAAQIDDNPGELEVAPCVFTAGTDTVILWQAEAGTFGDDIDAVTMRRSTTGNVFTRVGPFVSLSSAEPGCPRAANQRQPAIGFDGCRHSYVYVENSLPHVACVFSGDYTFSEGHAVQSSTANTCSLPAIAFVPTEADPSRYAVVWQERVGGVFHVRGSFHAARRTAGGVSVVRTGCGAPGFTTGIRATGSPVLGHDLTVELFDVAGTPAINVGLATPPIQLCAGNPPCQLGVATVFATISGSSFRVLVPCDRQLIGASLAFQGIDVLAPFGCGIRDFGVPLRVTNTLVATFQ